MSEQLENIKETAKPTTHDTSNGDSKIWGVSMRGWISFLIIFTACYVVLAKIEAPEWFTAVVMTTVGFYFGQKSIK
jgi:hypothetical protein